MLQAGKYAVYKTTESGALPVHELPEETYFVLRSSDALATMTLRSYVANIFQVLDWGKDPVTGEDLTDEQVEELAKRADGAHILANEWAKKRQTLPD